MPGKNGAILTLADGSQVVLDSMHNGVVANQNGANVLLQQGSLACNNTGNTAAETVYNSARTPRGRQFSITLPDGSKVWMNAASSIRFPTVFTGKGKAGGGNRGNLFRGRPKEADMPFRVRANNKAEIEVLGTQFNVNAYEDEQRLYTTLLEGSVRVNKTLLKPGQQVQIDAAKTSVQVVDIEKVMAWKNGLFNFEGTSIEDVMKQIARWYDLEIVYEKASPILLSWVRSRGSAIKRLCWKSWKGPKCTSAWSREGN